MLSAANRIARSIPALLLVTLAAGAWAAGPPQHSQTFSTIASPDINLINLRGNVIVRGWSRSFVHADYVMASPKIEIDAVSMPSRGQADKIQLMTHLLDASLHGPNAEVDYTLSVPQDSSVEIRNPEGVVRIEGLGGDLWVESVGGAIFVGDASGHVSARSIGGDIEVSSSSGNIELSSVMGNLRLLSPTSSSIHARTSSGGIVYEGSVLPTAEYILETYSGNINVACPPSASFNLDARSVHGKVVHLVKVRRKPHHPSYSYYGNALYGTHNHGGAVLQLTSYRGNIYIRPQSQNSSPTNTP